MGVIGNETPRASVVGEIVPTHEFYDYFFLYDTAAAEMVTLCAASGYTVHATLDRSGRPVRLPARVRDLLA